MTQAPAAFDPSVNGSFDLDAPPAPWIDLGWIQNFARKSISKSGQIVTGIPASPLEQVRESLEAQVSCEFLSWTKLTMALATGSQHMNVIAGAGTSSSSPSGAQAIPAVSVQAGSTATDILLAPADLANFAAGSLVAVDVDYAGQTGYVGSPVAGSYVRQALTDIDYVRRVTFNVALVSQVSSTGLMLAAPLPGGIPQAGAKLQAIAGFVDREGGSFYQEWSALFVMQGSQRERICFYYPRLQPSAGAEESAVPLSNRRQGGSRSVLLKGQFVALPVTDPLDGERVLCYRSFFPAMNALV
jgi:hypothetical protein